MGGGEQAMSLKSKTSFLNPEALPESTGGFVLLNNMC